MKFDNSVNCNIEKIEFGFLSGFKNYASQCCAQFIENKDAD